MTISDDSLRELIALAGKADHKLPWYVTHTAPSLHSGPMICADEAVFIYSREAHITEDDAAFIVAACNSVSDLAIEVLSLRGGCAEIVRGGLRDLLASDRLRAENERLREAILFAHYRSCQDRLDFGTCPWCANTVDAEFVGHAKDCVVREVRK